MLSLNATLAQAFIRSQPWHGSLSAEQQARLLGRLNFVKGAKGDCLLAAGTSYRGAFGLLALMPLTGVAALWLAGRSTAWAARGSLESPVTRPSAHEISGW